MPQAPARTKPGAASKRPLVLAVDDSEDVRNFLQAMLKPKYDTRLAADGRSALAAALKDPQPDLILLDVEMPGHNGYELCSALKANPATARIPVVFVSAHSTPKDQTHGLSLGAVDYITKPLSPPIVLARIATHLALASRTRQLESLVAERTRELQQTRLQLIQRLARALEFREGGSLTNRVLRIEQYVKLLAQAIGAKPEVCEVLAQASALHDIGTLGVSEAVMRKTDALDAAEWKEMRKHPEIGAAIIGEHKDPLLSTARAMALAHHERWDGKGYPKGLAGDAIPVAARILAVADAFEAMTATQRYRDPVPAAAAARTIASEAGKQFDPAVIAAFRKALPKIADVQKTVRDELKGIHDLDFRSEDSA
ncbi:MAG TPA: HD domain-containing phosphohydrolase [Burkholderiales bacterium]|nr:HD domain-containing phosphohydrolase [Burkholderiales bacterium]